MSSVIGLAKTGNSNDDGKKPQTNGYKLFVAMRYLQLDVIPYMAALSDYFSPQMRFKMHVIHKFSGTWSIYNAKTGTTRTLQQNQVEIIKELFADDLKDSSILDILQIVPISANKLQQLTAGPVPSSPPKKAAA